MTTPPPWGPYTPGPPDFILDTSVALAWLIGGPGAAYAFDVATRLHTATAAVPSTWAVELADLVRRRERSGQVTAAGANRYLGSLLNFRFAIDDQTSAHAVGSTFTLARTRRVSVPDAAYLELALRLRLPLATVDATLRRAAAAAGVPMFVP